MGIQRLARADQRGGGDGECFGTGDKIGLMRFEKAEHSTKGFGITCMNPQRLWIEPSQREQPAGTIAVR